GADRLRTWPKHFVAGGCDAVVAVALDALPNLHRVEHHLVRAGLKELRLPHVALTTDIGDGSKAGRRGAVVAVAIIASRRREILSFIQRCCVHTAFVLVVLVGWDLVSLHVLGVGVTL